MKALIKKTKFDFFHLILIFAALVGTLFAVFIFKTARPQAIKLIRWSPVDHYEEIIDSINKRQYPLLKNTYNEIVIHGASKIDVDAKTFIDSLQRVTQISATALEGATLSASSQSHSTPTDRTDDTLHIKLNHSPITQATATKSSATLAAENIAKSSTTHANDKATKTPTAPVTEQAAESLARKANESSVTLNLFIEVYYFMDLADIHPEEFYDPKALTKAIKKTNAPHLFTAYQKSADSIYIDVISIK